VRVRARVRDRVRVRAGARARGKVRPNPHPKQGRYVALPTGVGLPRVAQQRRGGVLAVTHAPEDGIGFG
jgi:hypothetical protein